MVIFAGTWRRVIQPSSACRRGNSRGLKLVQSQLQVIRHAQLTGVSLFIVTKVLQHFYYYLRLWEII